MISEMEKMSVAQNCEKYKSNRVGISTGFGNMSQSCTNCTNYLKEHCTADTYENTLNLIKIN